MKTPFKDRISDKQKKMPYEFAAPTGDQIKMAAGTGYGMGDSYGTGIKAKMGTTEGSSSSPVPKGSMKIPPKSLA
ncbi:MAG: hypothetical protein KGZ39_00360 [Simkania sp.]|nr:hypothetical protein [Simkania sp.]